MDFVDIGAAAALGCGATHLIEDGLEDGETGADDAEVAFEAGEHADDGVGFLRVRGRDCGGVIDAVGGDSADTVG